MPRCSPKSASARIRSKDYLSSSDFFLSSDDPPVAMSAAPVPSRLRVRVMSVSAVVRVIVAMRAMMTVPLQRPGHMVQRKVIGTSEIVSPGRGGGRSAGESDPAVDRDRPGFQ